MELSVHLATPCGHLGSVISGIVTVNSSNNHNNIENIEWLAAQLHGHVWIDPDHLTLPILNQLTARRSLDAEHADLIGKMDDLPDVTSFSSDHRPGTCLYVSRPKIIASDVALDQGKFTVQFVLPIPKTGLCPTLKGKDGGVFYVFSMTCKVESREEPTTIHLPFDILGNSFSFCRKEESLETEDKKNAYITVRDKLSIESASLPIAVRHGYEIPVSVSPYTVHGRYEAMTESSSQIRLFTIEMANNTLLTQLMLYKQSYFPGQVIAGIFDFSKCNAPVVSEIHISLQYEESAGELALCEKGTILYCKTYDSCNVALDKNTIGCPIELRIPEIALACITTDLLCFKWKLQFEFTLRDNGGNISWSTYLNVRPPEKPHNVRNLTSIPAEMYITKPKSILF